jgi:dTMP kinase
MLGKLIVFEGTEGAGKTTQIELARQWLFISGWTERLGPQSEPVVVTRQPGGTPVGQRIRQLLLDASLSVDDPICDRTELLLFAADRAQHVESWILPHLRAGRLVLCDRFTDSTVAYQGYGRGMDRDLIDQLNQMATAGLVPDLVLWFDLPVTTGLQRVQTRTHSRGDESPDPTQDRIEANTLDFHQRVQSGFLAQATQSPHRIIRIAADQSPAQVNAEVQTVLQAYLQQWYPIPSAP